jgi:hypothetical protein
MSIVGLLLVLVLIGVVLAFLPMDARMKQIVIAIVAILVAVWLLELFGVLSTGTFPHLRHR